MKNFLKKIKSWHIFLLIIFLLAAFLRFYNLENSLMFQGDQGRDSIIVSKIFKDKNLVFIGPVTSIGNMYLGPFYYYFMLPFLFLSYPSPIGPIYGVAALSLITVALIFFITKKLFNQKTAFIATIFFSLSSTVIEYARFSWNPNIAPFFGLLMFYFTYLAWKKNTKYWIWVSICFSLLIQLHYVTLLSLGGAGLIYLAQLRERVKNKNIKVNKKLFKHTILAILIFLLSLTPLMLFDLKHDWRNMQSFSKIFSQEESFDLDRKVGRTGIDSIVKYFTIDLKEKGSQLLFETSFAVDKVNHPLLFLTTVIVLIYLIKNKWKLKKSELVLMAYLIPSILGIALYQHNVYSHYLTFLYPLIYIFYALIFAKIKKKLIFLVLFLPFLSYFIYSNIQRYPIKDNSWTISDMQKVADSIYQRVETNEKYNLVLLSESKDLYGMNYRYFLDTKENRPVIMENHHLAEKLFIINEEKKQKNLADLPIYEIQVFSSKKTEVYQLNPGPEITVLTNY